MDGSRRCLFSAWLSQLNAPVQAVGLLQRLRRHQWFPVKNIELNLKRCYKYNNLTPFVTWWNFYLSRLTNSVEKVKTKWFDATHTRSLPMKRCYFSVKTAWILVWFSRILLFAQFIGLETKFPRYTLGKFKNGLWPHEHGVPVINGSVSIFPSIQDQDSFPGAHVKFIRSGENNVFSGISSSSNHGCQCYPSLWCKGDQMRADQPPRHPLSSGGGGDTDVYHFGLYNSSYRRKALSRLDA